MTRFIARIVLTSLSLVLLFAGSFNLNRASADEEFAIVSDCEKYAGCKGGPTHCGSIDYPNGSSVNCGMR